MSKMNQKAFESQESEYISSLEDKVLELEEKLDKTIQLIDDREVAESRWKYIWDGIRAFKRAS